MPQSAEELNVEPVDGWVQVTAPHESTIINPAAAIKAAQQLMLAAQQAMEQRESAAAA